MTRYNNGGEFDGCKSQNVYACTTVFIHSLTCLFCMRPKSTENCVCILHNLSYQIEAELPNSYARDFGEPLLKSLAPEPKAVGCFAHRSAKITEVILSDNDPH